MARARAKVTKVRRLPPFPAILVVLTGAPGGSVAGKTCVTCPATTTGTIFYILHPTRARTRLTKVRRWPSFPAILVVLTGAPGGSVAGKTCFPALQRPQAPFFIYIYPARTRTRVTKVRRWAPFPAILVLLTCALGGAVAGKTCFPALQRPQAPFFIYIYQARARTRVTNVSSGRHFPPFRWF